MNIAFEVEQIANMHPLTDSIKIRGHRFKVLHNFAANYKFITSLKEDRNSAVNCYRSYKSSRLVTIKETLIDDSTNLALLKNEVRILKTLRRSDIVRYRDSFIYFYGDEPIHAIVTDYIHGLTLLEYINSMINEVEEIPSEVMLSIELWIFEILKWIHNRGYVHRDIKPENIIIDTKKKKFILLDFGLACSTKHTNPIGIKTLEPVGTPAYISPERWSYLKMARSSEPIKSQHGLAILKKSDVWAAGIVLYCMAEKKLPWKSRLPTDICMEIISFDTIQIKNTPAPISDLIKMILIRDPDTRPSASYMVKYIKNIFRAIYTVPIGLMVESEKDCSPPSSSRSVEDNGASSSRSDDNRPSSSRIGDDSGPSSSRSASPIYR